jgi:hypothetical protein
MNPMDERLASAEKELSEARQAWYVALPEFPAEAVECPECGLDWTEYGHLQKMEEGYQRWTNGNVVTSEDEGRGYDGRGVVAGTTYVHWSTDGWDDMSESGDHEYVQCNAYNGGCGACFQIPEIEEYD